MCESLPQDLKPASKTAVQKYQTETLTELQDKYQRDKPIFFFFFSGMLHLTHLKKRGKEVTVQIILHEFALLSKSKK